MEFSEIYKDDDVQNLGSDTVDGLHVCMYIWGLSVLQFSLTIALPEDGLKDDEEDEETESEDQFERMSYFRTAKLQNKVAPMSYMQYKSMLREGMNNNNDMVDGGTVLTSRRHTNQSVIRNGGGTEGGATSFRDKYPSFSPRRDDRNGFRSKPNGLEPLSVTSPKSARMAAAATKRGGEDSNNIYFNNNSTSNRHQGNGSLSPRSETWSGSDTHRQKKISLPHGGRLPTNIGSPPPTGRAVAFNSPVTARSKKQSTNSRGGGPITGLSDGTRPSSKGSSTGSTNSGAGGRSTEQKKFSSDSRASDSIKTWDRLLDRIPWSKKRRRQRADNADFHNPGLQRKDSTKEDNSLGIGKKEVKGCFYKYLDLIAILLPVCMQDGPFFIVRFVLIAHYNVITGMLPILLTKNALVIIVNIYRILILYCSEPPKDEHLELDDPSIRVRAAMDTNQKLSDRTSMRAKRASIAVQALTRMQSRLFGQQDTAVLRQTRQNEMGNEYNDSPA